ncbi:MAG: sigma-70 family RNA polymerase sigma factor [Verrucomicrobiae bacterium]|nr:sigma-70 family RNA polymerase sigma factor [Verrucomicrobiae bacterium]
MTEYSLNPDLWNISHRDYLLRFALQRVKDYGTAEDLVQDTFLSAWHAKDKFRGDCTERTWLTGILRNKIIDFYRRRARRPSVLAIDLTPVDEDGEASLSWIERQPDSSFRHLPGAEVERTEFLGDLEKALSRLPDKMGKAFRMREIQGCSTEEITRELNISKANLWVLIHRAKQALGESLAEPWGGSDGFGSKLAA